MSTRCIWQVNQWENLNPNGLPLQSLKTCQEYRSGGKISSTKGNEPIGDWLAKTNKIIRQEGQRAYIRFSDGKLVINRKVIPQSSSRGNMHQRKRIGKLPTPQISAEMCNVECNFKCSSWIKNNMIYYVKPGWRKTKQSHCQDTPGLVKIDFEFLKELYEGQEVLES